MLASRTNSVDNRYIQFTEVVLLTRGFEPTSDSYCDSWEGRRFLRVSDISEKRSNPRYTNTTRHTLVLKDDIILVLDGSPGVVARGYEGAISSGLRKLEITSNAIYPDWLFHRLQASDIQSIIYRNTTGTTIFHASNAAENIQFMLPDMEVQREIAIQLDDVDNAIQQMGLHLEKHQAIKFSVLNSLTSEGLGGDSTGWHLTNLGQILKERKERGDGTLPLHSVTLRRGLVPRAEMNRHISSEMPDDQNAIVRKGDLAYNMMRMWQGGSGIAQEDCLVSPAYVVCRPTEDIDSDYLGYLVKSDKMLRHFIAHSEGVAKDRWRLYYRNLVRIPVELPPIDEQREIAEVLKAQDEVIASIETDLLKLKRIKHNLADDLLMGRVVPPKKAVAHA